MCRVELECFEKWKEFFLTREKNELVEAINLLKRTRDRFEHTARDHFIAFAEEALNQRFPKWDCPF